jgi:hypothetical protein
LATTKTTPKTTMTMALPRQKLLRRSTTAKQSQATEQSQKLHRTSAYNLTHVHNYPKKLVIYQLAASPYWWVRYYMDGHILRRSTKETSKRQAIEYAKSFYDEILYNRHNIGSITKQASFAACSAALLEQQEEMVARGDMSAEMQQNDRYRLRKEVLPFFENIALGDIDYFKLEQFINKLAKDKLKPATISNYVGLVSKTLRLAQRRGFIAHLPQFPKVKKADTPRGWFTVNEYKLLWRTAQRLSGQTWEVRKLVLNDGSEEIFCCQRMPDTYKPRSKAALELKSKVNQSQLLRRVEMTEDLRNLITFMSNSFIRPTDIKWMQHKHVEVITSDQIYLRLNLPASKKHDKPIVTMPSAVRVYLRQKQLHFNEESKINNAKPDDFVFLPYFKAQTTKLSDAELKNRRDAALTQLQRQFAVVLQITGLGVGARGEERSLYSLRHTCIMYRLLYGDGLDLLTLARNARTSVEMIDRFYASHLTGEMNISALQSKKRQPVLAGARVGASDQRNRSVT